MSRRLTTVHYLRDSSLVTSRAVAAVAAMTAGPLIAGGEIGAASSVADCVVLRNQDIPLLFVDRRSMGERVAILRQIALCALAAGVAVVNISHAMMVAHMAFLWHKPHCVAVAEMADAPGFGPGTRQGVGVRIPPAAPLLITLKGAQNG